MTTTPPADPWDRAPCGLLTLQPSGMIIEANSTFLGWVARDRAEVLGRLTLSELLSVGGRIYWETHLSPLLHVDGRVDEVALELKAPGGRLPVLVTAEMESETSGSPAVVRVAIATAKERSRYERELVAARAAAERTQARVDVLQATTAALSQALGVAAVADALVRAVLDQLGADALTIWLNDADQRLVVHAAEGDVADAEPPPSGLVLAEPAAVEDNGRIVVPLRGHTDLQGALSITQSDRAGAEPLDLEVLTAIGQQAGLALERARLYEQSASVARELQHSLLAVEPPDDPRYDVAAIYRPGVELLEVGGDWYDVFVAADDRLAVVVGDVVGRGLAAASAMGQLRSAVRAVAGAHDTPGHLLTRLDDFVEHVEAASMATVFYGELDLQAGTVRHASAGHPPPLLLPVRGRPRLLWEGRSTPLGGFISIQDRPDAVVELEPGDRLLLYTDGLVERRDRDIDQGLDLLISTAERVARLPLEDAVRALTELLLQDEIVRDDVCVLLLSWREPLSNDSEGSVG